MSIMLKNFRDRAADLPQGSAFRRSEAARHHAGIPPTADGHLQSGGYLQPVWVAPDLGRLATAGMVASV
jgi:hypothetical protein